MAHEHIQKECLIHINDLYMFVDVVYCFPQHSPGETLSIIFEKLQQSHEVPADWKRGNITPFLKTEIKTTRGTTGQSVSPLCPARSWGGQDWGIFKPKDNRIYMLRPVSFFYMMNIIMVLRMSGTYLGQENSVSFVIHCITMTTAVSITAVSACLATMQLTWGQG